MRYIESASTDPAWNLALEQYVFDSLPREDSYFMLWQNKNTVVVGKYQNTIAEINNDYCREHDIRVVRRLSGGGAVFHDLGNLNFTFITDADKLEGISFRMFCEPVIRALAAFGVKGEISGRNDMTIDGRKFSGNSQYVREHRVMHHGCILIDSDLSAVGKALHVDEEKIASKGVKSVVSRVTRLSDWLPEGTGVQGFKQQLLAEIARAGELVPYELTEKDLQAVERIKTDRYDTWQWNYGRSPDFETVHKKRIEGCGTVEVSIRAEKGIIRDLQFFGDFFALREPQILAERLNGCELRRQAVLEALGDLDPGSVIRNLTRDQLTQLLVL